MKLVLLAVALVACGPLAAKAQSCVTPDDVKQMVARLNSGTNAKYDKKLNEQLFKMAEKHRELLQQIVAEDQKKKSDQDKLRKLNEKNVVKFCEILKTNGWPSTALAGQTGVLAAFHILKNCATYELQRDLLPVILAVIKKDPTQKPEFAGLFDRLRVSAGMKQFFGTQAVSVGGFLVLYPLEDESKVNAWRQEFGLSTLQDNIRKLERIYGKPLIKSRQPPASKLSKQLSDSIAKAVDSAELNEGSYVDPGDVIKVETNLVSLNVSVFNTKSKLFVGSLTKDDFRVLEDGQEQTVTYFASTDVPFDLVLLVDLSGSTSEKRDLIKKSTLRFIQAARPEDRLAIVTFSDKTNVVSPLTLDRAQLAASVANMNGLGGSNVWDAVKFVLADVIGPKTLERRRAVVLMSDGVDGALFRAGPPRGSKVSFADLLEQVRQTDTLIVPIYLDTEESGGAFTSSEYENARRTLNLLAMESGGSYYQAKKLSDLKGVYEQVINDLGKVYSLGYKPTNPARDNTWRNVKISIVNREDLVAHARPGYYAQ